MNKIDQAEKLFDEGKINEAQELLWEFLINNPNDKVAWNNLGVIGFHEKKISKAIVFLKQSLNIAPNYKDAIMNLYRVLRSCESADKALPYVELALKNGGNDLELLQIYQEITNMRNERDNLQNLKVFFRQKLANYKTLAEKGDLKSALEKLDEIEIYDHGGEIDLLRNEIYYGHGYPKTIVLEPTDICNLRCLGCPRDIANNGRMAFNKFKEIINEMAGFLSVVILHDFGESFTHPDILQMIKFCSNFGINTFIDTNGNVRMDPIKIIESGLTSLTFAVDGLTQEVYQKYRVGGSLHKVFENMKSLIAAKKKLKTQHPRIVMKFVIMKTNQHQKEEAKKIAKQLEVDELLFSPFSVTLNERDEEYIKTFVSPVEDYVKEDKQCLDKGLRRRKYFGEGSPHCYGVNNDSTLIKWNGDVLPCCNIEYHTNEDNFRSEVIMGNVFDDGGFKPVWDNDKYRQFRKKVTLNRDSHPFCIDCTRRYLALDNYFIAK